MPKTEAVAVLDEQDRRLAGDDDLPDNGRLQAIEVLPPIGVGRLVPALETLYQTRRVRAARNRANAGPDDLGDAVLDAVADIAVVLDQIGEPRREGLPCRPDLGVRAAEYASAGRAPSCGRTIIGTDVLRSCGATEEGGETVEH